MKGGKNGCEYLKSAFEALRSVFYTQLSCSIRI